ncbi:hypothetical protein [Sphingopyxis sp. DBS4]|uniref:hypothetical protein n=1 Tax=Sphingopyxis sp. DBS4 TaxID=2968500 RepID=UPI00214A928D|nr:hypothetical protein [Sphingopyxis sp. DBS4]
MRTESSNRPIMPVVPEPFALIVGRMGDGGEAGFMGALRRMGLRPETVTTKDMRAEAPLVRVRFGSTSALIGRASADTLDLADPLHPATSQLAPRLDETWRDVGRVWAVIPEAEGSLDTAGDMAVRLREFFKAMVLLIDLFDASHIFWTPARLWTDAPQFRDAIAEMLASGMPPVLHLVAFRRSDAPGGGAIVRTRGLALFGGQEIEGRIPVGWTVAEMVRRLARLALDILLNGPVAAPRRLRGLDPGEWVSLTPVADEADGSGTVRVEFGSDL